MAATRKIYDKEALGRAHVKRVTGLLAEALDKKGELARAARQYLDYLDLSRSDERWDAKRLLALADRCYVAGIYDRARDLYVEIADRVPDVRRRLAIAATRSGRADLAIEVLERMLEGEDVATSARGSEFEELADAILARAESLETGEDRTRLYRKAERIYSTLFARLYKGGQTDAPFYRLALGRARCFFRLDPDELSAFFRWMDSRGYLRDAPNREAFEELRKELEKRLPRKSP